MNSLNNRLTKNAREIIETCQSLSKEKNLKKINSLLVLKALVAQKGSLGNTIARSLKISTAKVAKLLAKSRNKNPISVYDVLIKAFRLAAAAKSPFVGTEHLIYGLLTINQEAKTLVDQTYMENSDPLAINESELMNQNNAEIGDFLGEINMMIDNFFSGTKGNAQKQSRLKHYCINLNDVVTQKDHVLVGREAELERISNILGRKMKNNPVLIGEPGVGKTAIVEGLALKIREGKAPLYLASKKILNLDLGLLVAGTTFRGEFEARLKEIINEARQNNQVILFIDEIHNLVGAGNAVGGMDAANILKPALSRGEIQVIGATTYDEYRKYIQKDAALERRFQPIMVKEPSVKQTLTILNGIKTGYEQYHNIKITMPALEQAAKLAKRYLPERFLPDSAIDLIDEAAAQIRSKGTELKIFYQIKEKQQKLDELIRQKEALVMTDHYEEAIHFRNKELAMSQELTDLQLKQKEFEETNPIELTAADIRQTLSHMVQIPLSLINQETGDIIPKVQNNLVNNLVGQQQTIEKILQTLRRQFSGIGNPQRPLGSFLFLGPTGVGKTLTAKLLSQSLSPFSKDALIQINMSEFMERHTVSRLLGAPAGYVGYDDSGELAEKVRRNPYSVILFDEIEKADPAVLNILLQILEEGTATDAKGRIINFKNTLVILTSNIGTYELNQASKLGFDSEIQTKKQEENLQQQVIEELRQQLPAELLNRLDHIIVFDNLTLQNIKEIVRKEIATLAGRVKEKSMTLKYQPNLIDFLAEQSIGKDQGGRLVRRKIEELVEPIIADVILQQPLSKGLHLSLKNGKLVGKMIEK